MTNHSQFQTSLNLKPRRDKSRGIALVTTLLLLSLMVAMTLAMVIAVSSDTLITRYYRNFRSSFYAADSGVTVARQYMLDQLEAAIPTGTISPDTQPITINLRLRSSRPSSAYGSSGTTANRAINAGGGAGSWPGSFQISAASLAGCRRLFPRADHARHLRAAHPEPPTEYKYVIYLLADTFRHFPGQSADHDQ